MGLKSISNRFIEITVDEASGSIVQITYKDTGTKHLLARAPELELGKPGMGLIELEPFYCSKVSTITFSDNGFKAICIDKGVVVEKNVELLDSHIHYKVIVVNNTNEVKKLRIRSTAYIACARGGFWDAAEGATYSCKYCVDFGYSYRIDTFSSTFAPPPPRCYSFEKHSYRSKYFPEIRWIAFIDTVKREGIAFLIKTPEAYGVVEDQFFNLELNIATPQIEVLPNSRIELQFEIMPLVGVSRIDYLCKEFAAAIEGNSIIIPGEEYVGKFIILPYKDMEISISGEVVFEKGMATIGKRGYCIDRVVEEVRKIPLAINIYKAYAKALKPISFEFKIPPLSWSMDRELYEFLSLRFYIGSSEVYRYISLNPDVAEVLERAPKELKGKLYRKLGFVEAIESEFMEREASESLYKAIALAKTLKTKKLIQDLKPSRSRRIIEEYLRSKEISRAIESMTEFIRTQAKANYFSKVFSRGIATSLDFALAYYISKNEVYLKAFELLLKHMSELIERGEFVTFFNAIHGGGGASRFAHLALALDLFENSLDPSVVEEAIESFLWLSNEIYKLTNAWTGNWEVSEAVALAALSAKIDHPLTIKYLEKALAVGYRSLKSFLGDGAWPELAVSYHLASLSQIMDLAEVLRYAGSDDLYKFSSNGKPVILKATEWLWNMLTPYNTAPALEDCNEFMPTPDVFILNFLRYKDRRMLYAYRKLRESGSMISNPIAALALAIEDIDIDAEREEPWIRSRLTVLKESGRAIIRSSEEPEALYLVFDFGPHGAWHGHPDKLNFEIYYNREPIIVDAGSAGYYNPRHWIWSRRSIAHNTITKGLEDHPETSGRLLRVETIDNIAIIEAEASISREGDKLTRRISIDFAKNDVEIYDRVEGEGIFRWNIHVMGKLININNMKYVVETPRSIAIIELPQQITIEEGFRGSDIKTLYLYFEKQIERMGEVIWRISLRQKSNVFLHPSKELGNQIGYEGS